MARRAKLNISRRKFFGTAAAGSLAAMAAPAILTAKKTDGDVLVGVEGHRYRVEHMWPQLPEKFQWQISHNVAFDSEGNLYVMQEGAGDGSNPTIFVFDGAGKYIRSFGKEFDGGGHGLEIRSEGGQDFLYITAYKRQRSFAKLDTRGEIVWRKGAPMECDAYAEGEDKFPFEDQPWGRDRFMPTNTAFLPDGGFFLTDGYGAFRVHRYDKDANYLSTFGEPATDAKANGTFNLPHGIWIDSRGDEPLVVVADRVLARLQWFSFDGTHRHTLDGFLLPANVDTFGDLLLVPDLVGRVTLLDKNNQVIAHLGDDSLRMAADADRKIRSDESLWQDGKFVHPHDACFDSEGNIFVAEWVARGRVTKLTRVG